MTTDNYEELIGHLRNCAAVARKDGFIRFGEAEITRIADVLEELVREAKYPHACHIIEFQERCEKEYRERKEDNK